MNARQEAFAREYAIDRNGKQAAIRAGYSPRSAEVTASKLLRNPKVAARVSELDQRHAEAAGLTAERIIQQRMKIAFATPEELAEWPGGRLSDQSSALTALEEIMGMRGRLAGGQDAETEIPGVIVVPARESRDDWAKANGVVEVDEHGNPRSDVN